MAFPDPYDPEVRLLETTRGKTDNGTNSANVGKDSSCIGCRGSDVVGVGLIIHTTIAVGETLEQQWPQAVQVLFVEILISELSCTFTLLSSVVLLIS